MKILDAGCGTGLLTKKMEAFGDVLGIDISPEALKFTKVRKVKTRKASVDNLPFPDNSFEVIISADVLYHQMVNDQKALEEFLRVLKPEGILILKLPTYNWLRRKYDFFIHTKKRYTAASLKQQLQMACFETLKITYLASFLFLPALLKLFIEKKLSSGGYESDVKMPPALLNNFLILLFKIENFLLHFINLPFGLSVLAVAQKKAG